MKLKLITLFLILFLTSVYAVDSITNLDLNPNGRLNEKILISGQYNDEDTNSFVLCKFIIIDSNGFKVDRWSDEYTFSDGTFYAEKTLTEPPYYRGDSYDVNVSCGTASASGSFGVEQPISITHATQQTFEFATDPKNLEPAMMLAGVIGFVLFAMFGYAYLIKLGGKYAGN